MGLEGARVPGFGSGRPQGARIWSWKAWRGPGSEVLDTAFPKLSWPKNGQFLYQFNYKVDRFLACMGGGIGWVLRGPESSKPSVFQVFKQCSASPRRSRVPGFGSGGRQGARIWAWKVPGFEGLNLEGPRVRGFGLQAVPRCAWQGWASCFFLVLGLGFAKPMAATSHKSKKAPRQKCTNSLSRLYANSQLLGHRGGE